MVRRRPFIGLLVAAATAAVLVLSLDGAAVAAQSQVGLGTATSYAVLAGSTVTNTGPSVISGDLGVSPGSAVTGFPPGVVQNGSMHKGGPAALAAKNDLVTAYNDAAGRKPVLRDETDRDLGGQTLVPGVYRAASSMSLTGTVTLNAKGDPDAVFVFQAGSTLITASNSRVALIGGAQACHVFWKVGSSATIGTTTTFVGSVLALSSISLQTGATVSGRMLARNGAVTLDTNTITRPGCSAPVATSSPSPSATSAPTSTPTATPSASTPGGGTPGGGTSGGPPGTGTPIPPGHPRTGRLPDAAGGGWLMVGLLCLGGAGAAAVRGSRRPRATDHDDS